MSFPAFPNSHLFPNQNIVVVGTGQSLMANWGSTSGLFNNDGNRAFLNTLKTYNKSGVNGFVNAGNGSAALFRSTAIVSGLADQNDYFIDDCGYYPSGTKFYSASNPSGVKSYFRGDPGAPAPVVGARYTDMLSMVTSGGYTSADVTDIIWCQGETEASSMRTDITPSITVAQYASGLTWLMNQMKANFANLKSFMILPLGRRSSGANATGYEAVRQAQRDFCTANPTFAFWGPEAYEAEQYNEVPLGTFTATSGQTAFTLTRTPTLPSTVAVRAVINNSIMMNEGEGFTQSGNTLTFSVGRTAGDTVSFFVDDTVHRSPAGNALSATRMALFLLSKRSKYNGNTLGPLITSASYDSSAGVINATVTHDKGSSLQIPSQGEYIGSTITQALANGGGQIYIKDPAGNYSVCDQIAITGYDTLQITPDKSLLNGSYQLVTAYGDMLPIDNDLKQVNRLQMVLDNAQGNNLPLRGGSPVTLSGSNTTPTSSALVVARNISAGPMDYDGLISADTTPVVTGLTIPLSLGAKVNNATASMTFKAFMSSTSVSRLRNNSRRGTYEADSYTATSGQTTFAMGFTYNASYDSMTVTVNGVVKTSGVDYNISGNNIVFISGLTSGDAVKIYNTGATITWSAADLQFPSNMVDYVVPFTTQMQYNYWTATAGQTVLPLDFVYDSATTQLYVYKGTTLYTEGTDYTISSGAITFGTGFTAGDVVKAIVHTKNVTLGTSVIQGQSAVYLPPEQSVTTNGSYINATEVTGALTSNSVVQLKSVLNTGFSGADRTVTGFVIQFKSTAVKQLVPLDFNIAAAASSGTQTLGTAMVMANTLIIPAGYRNTGTAVGTTLARSSIGVQMTSTTQVTGSKVSANSTISHNIKGTAIEFNAGYITVEHGNTVIPTLTASATTSFAASISDLSKAAIFYTGKKNDNNTSFTSVLSKEYMAAITYNTSGITMTRPDAAATSVQTMYWQKAVFP